MPEMGTEVRPVTPGTRALVCPQRRPLYRRSAAIAARQSLTVREPLSRNSTFGRVPASTSADSESGPAHFDRVTAGVAAGSAARLQPVTWDTLSDATKRRFMQGGLGRGLGSRSEAMARRLFDKEVPKRVKALGEPALKDFLKGKHFSHIESVSNAPNKAKWPSNLVFENGAKNVARGSKNMTGGEVAAAKSANRLSAVKTSFKSVAKGGAKAGLVSAAMEAVVSVPENILLAGPQVRQTGCQGCGQRRDNCSGCRRCDGRGRPWCSAVGGVSIAGALWDLTRCRWRGSNGWHSGDAPLQGCKEGPAARRIPCAKARIVKRGTHSA